MSLVKLSPTCRFIILPFIVNCIFGVVPFDLRKKQWLYSTQNSFLGIMITYRYLCQLPKSGKFSNKSLNWITWQKYLETIIFRIISHYLVKYLEYGDLTIQWLGSFKGTDKLKILHNSISSFEYTKHYVWVLYCNVIYTYRNDRDCRWVYKHQVFHSLRW